MNSFKCFFELWEYLGKFSGQFQTIAAFIGLALAIYALIYSKKQISFSQSERMFALKYQISNEYFQLIQNIETTLNKIAHLLEIELCDISTPHHPEIETNVRSLELQLKKVSKNLLLTKNSLNDFNISFRKRNQKITIDTLEYVLNYHIRIQDSILSTQNSVNNIEVTTRIIQKKVASLYS